MEPKKHPQADLSRKSGLFFSIGLMISLALALTSFEWKSYSGMALIIPGMLESDMEPIPDIKITVHEPPKPPVAPPKIIEVPDDEEINIEDFEWDVEITPDSEIEDIVFSNEPADEVADEILDFTEVMPEPIGGLKAFYRYVSENIRYPQQAKKWGIEGKVYLVFLIDRDGSIKEVTVLKGIGYGCDEEAVKVVSNAPKWKPGKQGGVPVKVRQRLPIEFKLQKY